MTGVDADLATLREQLDKPWCPNLGSCPPEMHSGCSYCAAHDDAEAALARVEAELSRLREQRDALIVANEAADETWRRVLAQAEAAEARCARLQQALETVRMELDLPEHIAEIVGDALAGPDTPAIPPRPPIQPPGHQREMADTPADSPEDKT